LDAQVKELVAVAAAVAVGCEPCLVAHVQGARGAGATARDIDTAIQIARAVRLQAIGQIDALASQLAHGQTVELVMADGSGSCGCGGGCAS
jgi:AhpD family alkylhydroperoxidase